MADVAAVADATPDASAQGADAPEPQGELKKLIAQRDALKAKVRELEPVAARANELERAQMTEQQKLAARIAELEPAAKRTADMEAAISALLEQELTGVPEEMRDVVPDIDPTAKLNWLRQAKAKGLFAAPAAAQPTNAPLPKRPAAAGGNTITKSALTEMPIGGKRAATMQAIREGKITVIDG